MDFFDLAPSGSGVALIDDTGSEIAYAALAIKADTIAGALPRSGARSLGFLLLDPSTAGLAAYLGCLREGSHVPLLLHPDLAPELLSALAYRYRPTWILAPRRVSLPVNYNHRAAVDGLVLGAIETPAEIHIHADTALLLSTSGTTGSEKLVRLSYAAIASNARAIARYLELTPADRAITTMPPSYSFGLSIINSHLEAGATIILNLESIMSRGFWTRAAQCGITSLSGVPSTFEMLRRVGLATRGLERLRTLTQAGGAMRTELTSYFDTLARSAGWRLFVMYGQTEAAPRISYVPPDRLGEKLGSIGIPIPGGVMRIDPETSELLYEGPNVMMGYAESREDLARGDDCGGLLRTGDLAEVDAEGFFWLTGRLKRFVKLSGLRVNLDTLESRLATELGATVACTGADDRLHIWLLDKNGTSDERVLDLVRSLFGIYSGLVGVRRVSDFPLTPNGKIDFKLLQE